MRHASTFAIFAMGLSACASDAPLLEDALRADARTPAAETPRAPSGEARPGRARLPDRLAEIRAERRAGSRARAPRPASTPAPAPAAEARAGSGASEADAPGVPRVGAPLAEGLAHVARFDRPEGVRLL